MDTALLTLFVKIIKHFFSSSEFLFFCVFSGDVEAGRSSAEVLLHRGWLDETPFFF